MSRPIIALIVLVAVFHTILFGLVAADLILDYLKTRKDQNRDN